jgi:hypothetical protein
MFRKREEKMFSPKEPLKIHMVKVRALKNNFYFPGHVAEIGEEGIVDISDASFLACAGKVEIIGEADPKLIPVSDLRTPSRHGWVGNW